jgi:NADP-dependent 3-hydroxy acid dehydrogenase YdfG
VRNPRRLPKPDGVGLAEPIADRHTSDNRTAVDSPAMALATGMRALKADGIRVLTVYPGRTATRMQARIFRDEGRSYVPETLLQPADIARTVVSALALPRSAEVTEVRARSLAKP